MSIQEVSIAGTTVFVQEHSIGVKVHATQLGDDASNSEVILNLYAKLIQSPQAMNDLTMVVGSGFAQNLILAMFHERRELLINLNTPSITYQNSYDIAIQKSFPSGIHAYTRGFLSQIVRLTLQTANLISPFGLETAYQDSQTETIPPLPKIIEELIKHDICADMMALTKYKPVAEQMTVQNGPRPKIDPKSLASDLNAKFFIPIVKLMTASLMKSKQLMEAMGYFTNIVHGAVDVHQGMFAGTLAALENNLTLLFAIRETPISTQGPLGSYKTIYKNGEAMQIKTSDTNALKTSLDMLYNMITAYEGNYKIIPTTELTKRFHIERDLDYYEGMPSMLYIAPNFQATAIAMPMCVPITVTTTQKLYDRIPSDPEMDAFKTSLGQFLSTEKEHAIIAKTQGGSIYSNNLTIYSFVDQRTLLHLAAAKSDRIRIEPLYENQELIGSKFIFIFKRDKNIPVKTLDDLGEMLLGDYIESENPMSVLLYGECAPAPTVSAYKTQTIENFMTDYYWETSTVHEDIIPNMLTIYDSNIPLSEIFHAYIPNVYVIQNKVATARMNQLCQIIEHIHTMSPSVERETQLSFVLMHMMVPLLSSQMFKYGLTKVVRGMGSVLPTVELRLLKLDIIMTLCKIFLHNHKIMTHQKFDRIIGANIRSVKSTYLQELSAMLGK